MKPETTDPMEMMIASALNSVSLKFEREKDGLDFYLPQIGV